jgi:3-mercaptopyruvate sulfurtransferase SseA
MPKTKSILVISILLFLTACNALTSAAPARTTAVPPPQSGPPLTEADVPRVSLEQARAALDDGTAVFVDVRSAEAYSASHIAGAINIPLNEIEADPTALTLAKDQWIITYCT